MSRYLSKKQEVYFQPRRIRVLDEWQRYSGQQYRVVIQDMLTHEVVATWVRVRDDDGYWSDEQRDHPKSKRLYPGEGTKGMAMQVAKREAKRRKLPFDLQSDVLKYRDAVEGPIQPCVICGSSTKTRSFAPLVCQSCLIDAKTGAVARSEKHEWKIHLDDLLPYVQLERGRHFDVLERQLGKLLVRIAGTALGSMVGYDNLHKERRIRARTGGSKHSVEVQLHDDQGQAIQELLEFLKGLIKLYEARGEVTGSNLLGKLASGEVSSMEFALRREEAMARTVERDIESRRKGR